MRWSSDAGPFAEHPLVAAAQLVDLPDRSRHARVNRDEVLRAEKEIDVLGPEAVLARAEVDAVQDQIQVVAVGLDLGMVELR